MRWTWPWRRKPTFETRFVVTLGPHHIPRGDRHQHVYVNPDGTEESAPDPAKLQIDEASDGSALLHHLDDDDEWVADSWHASVEEALASAEHDFGVRRDEWASA